MPIAAISTTKASTVPQRTALQSWNSAKTATHASKWVFRPSPVPLTSHNEYRLYRDCEDAEEDEFVEHLSPTSRRGILPQSKGVHNPGHTSLDM